MTLRIAKLIDESVVDGPGVRFVVFTQGCVHGCWDCQNPQTHNMYGGEEVDIDIIMRRIDKSRLISGVTFSGGEPLVQLTPLIELAARIKRRNLSVLVYTGYTWEYLMGRAQLYYPLLHNVDYIIDGPYKHELRTIDTPFIGSSNQRMIDVTTSIFKGVACEAKL